MFEVMMKDFAWTGFLLLTGAFLRKKVPLFQKLYIPGAVIGGLVGILLGPEVLGRISPVSIKWSGSVYQYSTFLLAMVFSVLFLGVKVEHKTAKRVISVWMIATIVLSVQFLSAAFITKILNLEEGFSLLPQSGFFGGHGIPQVLGGIWRKAGYWNDREINTLGSIFATTGLLFATVSGIFWINLAARKNWLVAGKNPGTLNREEKTGYIEPENRTGFMMKMTTEQNMESLAFHVSIVFVIMLCSMELLKFLYWCAAHITFMKVFENLNIMSTALLMSLIFSFLMKKAGMENTFDVASLRHVGAVALEFVIVLSIATTNLNVLKSFGMAIFLASSLGLIFTTAICFGLSRLWMKSNWFEHGILMMGAYTGVLATGLMLLRIADPDRKTDAATDVIAASPLWILTSQNFYLAVAPVMLTKAFGFSTIVMISFLLAIAGLLLGFALKR